MAISAGLMTERVQVLVPVDDEPGEMGGQNVLWCPLGDPKKARVTYQKGARALDMGEVWLPHGIVVTIRWTLGVTERCRLVWNERTYQIESLNGSRREGMWTIVASRVNDE